MGTTTLRHPAVAGQFYPCDAEALRFDLQSYLTPSAKRETALGCVVPHAGYMYSGHVAGAVYAHLDIPERCILLCPNHTGKGHALSIMTGGAWETPLGNVPIDADLAAALVSQFPFLADDAEAHRTEHAIEVQLPFLQTMRPDVRIVPITIRTRQYDALAGLGQAIGQLLATHSDRVLVLASSDMNHYEPDQITRVKDHTAIEHILALDPRGLYDAVMSDHISMCGYGPTVAMLTAARDLGATAAQLIKYATSGDISGDRDMVVGYAGITVT
jgi:MEMO1 family protein